MKLKPMTMLIAISIMLTNCGDNKATTNENQEENASSSEKKTEKASNSPAQADDIVGEWEMVSFVGDTNDNLQIDDDERAKLKPASFKNYMKLNSDGTGLFTIGKMEGRYEIKEESNGRKFMTWYDKADGPHRVGAIMKVTKDEMTIKEPGGNGLFLWKRL